MSIVFKEMDHTWLHGLPPRAALVNPLLVPQHQAEENSLVEMWKLGNEYYSPAWGIKYFLGVRLYPYQISTILAILKHKFPMLLFSRGGAKTFTLALIAIYYGLMFPGSRILLISASFRQAKNIFNEIVRIYEKYYILQELSTARPTFGVDRCTYKINNSEVVALPLGQGDKIRGERSHLTLVDEFDCLDANSIIETTSGLVRIKDIIESRKKVELYTGDDNLEKEHPTKYIKTPIDVDVYELQTEYGFRFKCSERHKVMTLDGWKLVKDVRPGEYLTFENHYQFPEKNIQYQDLTVDEELAWLMGSLIAEGNINHKWNMGFTSTDENYADKVARILSKYTKNKIGKYVREEYIDERGWKCKKGYYIYLCDLKLREKLDKIGLHRAVSGDKITPACILKSPKNVVLAYLKGLFEGDGSIFDFKTPYRKEVGAAYYSKSQQLCQEVQLLVSKFDILGSFYSRITQENLNWVVSFRGYYASELHQLLNLDKANSISYDSCHQKGVSFINSVKKWRANHSVGNKCKYQGLFETKQEAIEAVGRYKKTLRVKKVELLSEKQTLYDFYLPKTHSFFANGFRQHNSINPEIFDVVVRGFSATQANPFDKTKELMRARRHQISSVFANAGNKIVLSGTAGYTNGTLYRMYRQYRTIIDNRLRGSARNYKDLLGDDLDDNVEIDYRQYCIITYKYTELPPGMMDTKVIHNARATMPKFLFDMEYNTKFCDHTQGFFKFRDIDAATSKDPDGFSVQMEGTTGKQYILGIDPARTTDRFAIVVLEVGHKLRHVWSSKNQTYRSATKKIRELLRKFKVVAIGMDAGGGGLAIEEFLQLEELMEEGDKKIYREDCEDKVDGLKILHMINFVSAWIDEANTLLQKNIEDKTLMFPVEYSNIDAEDIICEEISDLKKELVSIQVTYTKTGKRSYDLMPADINTTNEVVRHKDRYSALLIANYVASRMLGPKTDLKAEAKKKYQSQMGGWAEQFMR